MLIKKYVSDDMRDVYCYDIQNEKILTNMMCILPLCPRFGYQVA